MSSSRRPAGAGAGILSRRLYGGSQRVEVLGFAGAGSLGPEL